MANRNSSHKEPKCKSKAKGHRAPLSTPKLESENKLVDQTHGGTSTLSENCAKMLQAALALDREDSSKKTLRPIRFGPDRVASDTSVLARLLKLECQIREKTTDAHEVRDNTQAILKALLKCEQPRRVSASSKGPPGKYSYYGVQKGGAAIEATPATSLNCSSKIALGKIGNGKGEGKGKSKPLATSLELMNGKQCKPVVVVYDSQDFNKWKKTEGNTVQSVVEYFTSKGNERHLTNRDFWASFGFGEDEVLEVVFGVLTGQYTNPGPSEAVKKFASEMDKVLNVTKQLAEESDDSYLSELE